MTKGPKKHRDGYVNGYKKNRRPTKYSSSSAGCTHITTRGVHMVAALSTLRLFSLAFIHGFVFSSSGCQVPKVASNFTNSAYNGLWYEIGKIQTAGGAFFEKDCVCTTIDIKPVEKATNGDSIAINSCRKLTPTGDFLNATGQLVNEGPAGHWQEAFFPLAPKASYTIIYLNNDLAIEYDCSSVLGIYTNYCIHILSRKPTADNLQVNNLLSFAEGLGLNTEKLQYQKTLQNGCW
ncbi:hypothetical protein FSP39_016829 [Pinctada imbricata]|uniref:Lipocalin/cytosolic fatty-acid binding domain-containing protein n=1 Tax=Pinctada imbricata TaxID=66713 RepID=A0AA88YIV1_PINIB|nr:hypothetical protein FSP39_016829 [Pinctada imbricata]